MQLHKPEPDHLSVPTTQLEKAYSLSQMLKFEDSVIHPWAPSEEVMESRVNGKVRKTWVQISALPSPLCVT